MRLLLDTHVFLWFVLGDARLSSAALETILSAANVKLVSPAVYWEIAIKISLRKYALQEPYEAFMRRGIFGNGFGILPVESTHTAALVTMPFHHRDPFDRLLIAQALVEQIPIVSIDSALDAYGVTRIW